MNEIDEVPALCVKTVFKETMNKYNINKHDHFLRALVAIKKLKEDVVIEKI